MLRNGRGGLGQLVFAACADDDIRTSLRQCPSNRRTDTPTGAGNHRNLTVESKPFEHHVPDRRLFRR